ncbi:phage head spike fiber domain-containing protein [Martelella endophytica]|uniref:Uncharacterized protein n=1 Tax=Martelella endophytica TaxID=1486262 RepID=A0A0D5LSH1_MAREN|nr:hypothetical protein [Martelella endophytica]AJY47031.1 hypothetical protein TM49_17265 [Martelella endophytica]
MRNAGFAEMIDFTRPGTATYVDADGMIRIAAADVPRFDYTNGRRQLLLEGPATNTATGNSAAFNGSGGSQHSTMTAGQLDPAGGDDARLFTAGPDQGVQCAQMTANFTAATATTVSVFVKAGTSGIVQLAYSFGVNNTSFANFDLMAGTLLRKANCSAGISPVGSGWYRVSMTGLPAATAFSTFYVAAIPDAEVARLPAFEGAEETFYVWGPQVEASDFASSYIPTSGTAVTRPADKAQLTEPVAALLQRGEASVVVSGEKVTPLGTVNGVILGGYENADFAILLRADNNAMVIGYPSIVISIYEAPTPSMGVGVSWDTNGKSGALDGFAPVSTSSTQEAELAPSFLGRNATGYYAQGWYDQLVIWPFRVTDDDLQAKAVPYA